MGSVYYACKKWLFLILIISGMATLHGTPVVQNTNLKDSSRFKLSLAQWSFHKALFAGELKHLDFAPKAASLGFEGVEYVNAFFKDKATDFEYLKQMNEIAAKAGVRQVLIMIDGEGNLADSVNTVRETAIQNHKKWVDAAAFLGCHSIRVNLFGEGSAENVAEAAAMSLKALAGYAAGKKINIIVENHGGYSSNGAWLSGVMKKVNLSNCGTLPDFGNFCMKRAGGGYWGSACVEEYDKYKGVEELMPFAKAVSAKSNNFDDKGVESDIDYKRMMQIVKDSSYSGFIGVEYEGEKIGEEQGIKLTRDLLKSLF